MLLQPADGACGGFEAECAAASEHDRVHFVDHIERVQEIRFARAGRAAALRNAADRVAIDEHDRAASRALGQGHVPDLDTGDGSDRRVGRAGALRDERGCEEGQCSAHGGILVDRPPALPRMTQTDRVLMEIDRAADEIVQFTVDLVRIPTINPPGADYDSSSWLTSRMNIAQSTTS